MECNITRLSFYGVKYHVKMCNIFFCSDMAELFQLCFYPHIQAKYEKVYFVENIVLSESFMKYPCLEPLYI